MGDEKIDLAQFTWMNEPEQVETVRDGIEFSTSPGTAFWQRTHSGSSRANGHALLTRLWDDFSFTVQAEFFYESRNDQCGLLLYLDNDNWAKVCVAYVDEAIGMLACTVTAGGWSDWSGTPIATDYSRIHYRLSRRGNDFRFEYSHNGVDFQQIRMFHVHGDLSAARVGIYACSPGESSFKARFFDMAAGPNLWKDSAGK